MKGYKYRSIDQDNLENTLNKDVESLIANQLYASPFKALNDPFENIYNETISDFMNQIGKDTYDVKPKLEKVLEAISNVGIYSLSKSYNNELMWAHYANSHKGFCIEYDIDKLETSYRIPKTVHQFEVCYESKPQTLNIYDVGKPNGLKKLLAIKSKTWNYEKEIRLVFDTAHLKDYLPSALTGIYFGSEMKKEHKNYLIDALKDKNVKFYDINRKANSYKLDCKLIHENTLPSFPEDSYEIIKTNHNQTVENFYILNKNIPIESEALKSFCKKFRDTKTSMKSNIEIFDNKSILNLINKCPLNAEEEMKYNKHCIATSTFASPNDVKIYPYKLK